ALPQVLWETDGPLPCAARDRYVPRLGRHADQTDRRGTVRDTLRSPTTTVELVAAHSRDRPPVGPRGPDDGRGQGDATTGPMTGRRRRRAPGVPGRGGSGGCRERAGRAS